MIPPRSTSWNLDLRAHRFYLSNIEQSFECTRDRIEVVDGLLHGSTHLLRLRHTKTGFLELVPDTGNGTFQVVGNVGGGLVDVLYESLQLTQCAVDLCSQLIDVIARTRQRNARRIWPRETAASVFAKTKMRR